MTRTRLLVPAVLGALALVMGGCGGGSDAGSAPAPADVVVPDVVGQRPGAASDALCAAGLTSTLRIVVRTPAVRPARAALVAARVRGTDPAAGARVPPGTAVALRIALPRNVSVAVREGC